jgi:hypothetical protein
MEAGKNLVLEVIDTNMLSVSTSLPLGQFAAVRKGSTGQNLRTEYRRVDYAAAAAARSIGSISDRAVNGLVR